MAAEIASAALGLAKKSPPLDQPVPPAELAMLTGKFDSDDGIVETFSRDGKLLFRIPGRQIEGVQRRRAENVYAINENSEVHFVISQGKAAWGMLYVGGLFLDAKYRIN